MKTEKEGPGSCFRLLLFSMTTATLCPPPRPDKSKLRNLSTSSNRQSPKSTPNGSRPSTPSDTSEPVLTTPVRGKDRIEKIKPLSRFTEHFGLQPPVELMEKLNEHVPSTSQQLSLGKNGILGHRFSINNAAVMGKKNDVLIRPTPTVVQSSPSTPISLLKRSLSTSFNLQNSEPTKPPLFPSSVSTPHFPRDSICNPIEEQPQSTTRYTDGSTPRITIFSLNRAEVIVTRLTNWMQLIKAVSSWLEETSRMGLQSSQNHYQRVLPLMKRDFQEMDAMATINCGLRMLTLQLAGDQKEFSKAMQREHLPALNQLRKDCKERIRDLKADQSLALDELLKRAELTRKSIAQLAKSCQTVNDKGSSATDPWLANLSVLRYLKREVDEENRLNKLMLAVQRDTAAFERRILSVLKPTIQICYQKLAPGAWDGSNDVEAAPFQLMLDQIVAHREWKAFSEREKRELVDEENPVKNYLNINYPNKTHPYVMTLQKGPLERQFGVIKHFAERLFVLSHGGYLHQFRSIENVLPERSIYIPSATIVPMVDPGHLIAEAPSPEQGYIFKLCVPATNVLQREKTYVFRATTRHDYVEWVRLLSDTAGGAGIPIHSGRALPYAPSVVKMNTGSLGSMSEEDEKTSSKRSSHATLPPTGTSVPSDSLDAIASSWSEKGIDIPPSKLRLSVQSANSMGLPTTFGVEKTMENVFLNSNIYSTSAESFFMDPIHSPETGTKRFSAVPTTSKSMGGMSDDDISLPSTDDTPLQLSDKRKRSPSPFFPATTHSDNIESISGLHSLDTAASTLDDPSPTSLPPELFSLRDSSSTSISKTLPSIAQISSSLP